MISINAQVALKQLRLSNSDLSYLIDALGFTIGELTEMRDIVIQSISTDEDLIRACNFKIVKYEALRNLIQNQIKEKQ